MFDPADWDLEECSEVVAEDVAHDLGDADFVTRAQFRESLFETVDVWTETTDVDEYVAFLRHLFARITIQKYDPSSKTHKPRGYKPVDAVVSVHMVVNVAGVKNVARELAGAAAGRTSSATGRLGTSL